MAAVLVEDTPTASTEAPRLPVSPFVKWAGGKGQLLTQLAPFFPAASSCRRYFEPFLGGGAVFFHLQPAASVLSDLNAELINAYEIIRDCLAELISSLQRHQEGADYYYRVRAMSLPSLTPVQRASRFIYLNKRCYNGLYRVNSKGQFNVPIGRYKTPPRVFDPINLKRVSALLKTASLCVASYEVALAGAAAGDFVYLDPPYQPLSATANFTGYTIGAFHEADQARLADVLRDLDRRGIRFLLNNHHTPPLRRLYSDFRINVATASRMINSNASRRSGVEELIVTNYEPEAA